jgi:phosphonoacetaldehyde hydrolase
MAAAPLALQAVVLDWAGTIIDHGSRAPVEAFREIFRRRDVTISVDEARGPMGMEKRDHIMALLAMPRIAQAWRQTHGRDPNVADINEMYIEFLPVQSGLIAQHADEIPGVREALAFCRQRGLRIGSSSGYAAVLMEKLAPLAQSRGLQVDVVVSASDVPAGRPAPWMIFKNMERLGVYPPASVAVVDDTAVGVEAGVNAGAWSIGVVETGNLFGLSATELAQLSPAEREQRRVAARKPLEAGGAHFTINSVADLPQALESISERLARGERP